ncbi:hypothetical protein DYBT9275_00894 [Dyadobacter sp. CECT 9275]|uniref:Uncharacterized protein n=1 Tax=Dyadobacter helix TaxID=2822344 RepID=A0A916NK00_9BACT|nr:hypothetical protein DYBT9275_00894 [Dyadobacter sp. CECT 9275]
MKKNVPKFLIAKNEAAKPGSTYLVHTQQPPFIGELLTFDNFDQRNQYIEDNLNKEVISVTHTCLLVILKYLDESTQSKSKPYFENKVVHWIIANYLNSSVF